MQNDNESCDIHPCLKARSDHWQPVDRAEGLLLKDGGKQQGIEDEGFPGTLSREKRPALNSLIKDADRKEFVSVVCWDIVGLDFQNLLQRIGFLIFRALLHALVNGERISAKKSK